MLPQSFSFDKSQNIIRSAMKELRINSLLTQSNIRKACGFPVTTVFEVLILLVFHGQNLYRSLESKHNDHSMSKNVFYRFLSTTNFNWGRFLLLLAVRVTQVFHNLTNSRRPKLLVLDDSVIPRNRSKAVELLAKIYDHVTHKYVRGFNLLSLGWTDGYSFIPVLFNLMSSANAENRYQEASDDIDHRTNGWKARMESMLHKPEAALRMIRSALDAGISVEYILMDSWFTTEPFINELCKLKLDVIGMVKQLKQTYLYGGRYYTLRELANIAVKTVSGGKAYHSLIVQTKQYGIPVRIVFVRNRNNRSEFLYLLTTDLDLADDEIVRLYGNRWSIETFFKATKSLLKLCDEFQTRNYDSAVAHTALVFTRYTILEWIRRHDNDPKTYGGLFFALCEDVQDMELADALKSLMALFMEVITDWKTTSVEIIKSKLTNWINSQSSYIKALFPKLGWES